MKTEIILVLTAVQLVCGVIHQLNDSEYARLPPLFRLDDLHGCLRARGDKYCFLHAEILNGDSELHTLIKEYSADTKIHFNHSLIHWGICVTQTCRQYYENSTLEDALYACVNNTLYESHQLQTRLINEDMFCTDFGEADPYDASDYVVAAVFLALIMLNVFGTVYDLIFPARKGFHSIKDASIKYIPQAQDFIMKSSPFTVSRLLLCFSLRQNWRKLVMPAGEGPEPKLKSLKGLNGMKAMTTMLVILGHSPLTGFIAADNPHYQEELYHFPLFQFMMNGTLVVQTFFTISGFLLAYNILVTSEKRRMGWQTLPQGILLRWLRLTPVYAVIIAFVSTWLRHLSSGPLWKPAVNIEVLDCRRDWWLHMLYIDNYVDRSQCMPQAWYISGDMQLSILGMAIFSLLQGARARKIAIAIAFIVGLLTPAAHTFFQNLHAVLIVSPEMARHFFVEDPTFNNLYKRGHTNLVCYAMGLGLGMLMYQMFGQDIKNKKKLRWLYWAGPPVGTGFVMLGMVFYIDGIEVPLAVRVVYSSAIKMCFGACITVIIGGTLMKLDTVVRGILEWRGWTPMSRISYCAYLIHVCVMRLSLINITALQHLTIYHISLNYCAFASITFLLSVPCWLLVESPTAQLVKLCLQGGSRKSDVTFKDPIPKWKDQELSSSVETVVVKTTL